MPRFLLRLLILCNKLLSFPITSIKITVFRSECANNISVSNQLDVQMHGQNMLMLNLLCKSYFLFHKYNYSDSPKMSCSYKQEIDLQSLAWFATSDVSLNGSRITELMSREKGPDKIISISASISIWSLDQSYAYVNVSFSLDANTYVPAYAYALCICHLVKNRLFK